MQVKASRYFGVATLVLFSLALVTNSIASLFGIGLQRVIGERGFHIEIANAFMNYGHDHWRGYLVFFDEVPRLLRERGVAHLTPQVNAITFVSFSISVISVFLGAAIYVLERVGVCSAHSDPNNDAGSRPAPLIGAVLFFAFAVFLGIATLTPAGVSVFLGGFPTVPDNKIAEALIFYFLALYLFFAVVAGVFIAAMAWSFRLLHR